MRMVSALVKDINRMLNDDYFYFTECLTMWVLFAKREKNTDRRVAEGYTTVHELAALISVLQKVKREEILI